MFVTVALATTLSGFVGAHRGEATDGPALRVGDVTMTEGDSGVAPVVVPVALSFPSPVTINVPYAVVAADDGATDSSDFIATTGQLTFRPGVTSRPVSVWTIGDTVVEGDQHVLVQLGTPVGGPATVANEGVVTIRDDDTGGAAGAANAASATTATSPIEVTVGEITVTEGEVGVTQGSIPLTLSQPASVTTRVKFGLDCNALANLANVQMATAGTVVFRPGQRAKSINFKLYSDMIPERVRRISVQVSSRATVSQSRGVAIIEDDDPGQPRPPTPRGHSVPNFVPSPLPGPSSFSAQSVGQIDQLTLTPSGDQPTYQYSDPYHEGGLSYYPRWPSVSYDGRFVAFFSDEVDLVPDDTNGLPDLFVRDRATNTTERITMKPDGSQIDSSINSGIPFSIEGPTAMSADGRYVAYTTSLRLDPRDNDVAGAGWDVYLYDRVAHTTELVTVDTAGNHIHGTGPSISSDGRYVSFKSGAYLYVRDRDAGTTTMVFDQAFTPALGNWPDAPQMSANGRYLVTPATGFGCVDAELDVIDVSNGMTERVDVNNDGDPAEQYYVGQYYLYQPSISADGRYVSFKSASWNLVPGLTGPPSYTSGAFDISLMHAYVRDREALSTTMVGNGQQHASIGYSAISGDGAKVALCEPGGALFYPSLVGPRIQVGPGPAPNDGGADCDSKSLSGDGRYIVFMSGREIGPPPSPTWWPIFLGELFVQRVS